MLTKALLLFFTAASITAYCQTDTTQLTKSKVQYYNQFSFGALSGKDGQGTGVMVSMINGVRINRLAVGAGLSYDGYKNWNVVPIFGSASFDVARLRSSALYLQMNIGYSFASRIIPDNAILNEYREYGSQMINSMIGYRLRAQKYSLYIQAGHKYQVVHYSFHPLPSWSSEWIPRAYVEEELNRFVVAIGFGFN